MWQKKVLILGALSYNGLEVGMTYRVWRVGLLYTLTFEQEAYRVDVLSLSLAES